MPWRKKCANLMFMSSLPSAPVFSIAVFCAPIPTLRQVSLDRTVGNLPLLPYSSMIASAFLWVVYGILKSEPKIWSANGKIPVS
jgi:solute carrier family 50 (sugar transporter)